MGIIERLYTAPPDGSVVLCLDEMGPESARSFAGHELVRGTPAEDRPAERARQEADYRLWATRQGLHLRRLPAGNG